MKRFLVSVLRLLAALVVASILFFSIFAFIISALIGGLASQQTVKVPAEAVLVFDLDLAVPDSPRSVDTLSGLLEAMDPDAQGSLHLRALVDAIDHAAEDERIEALLIRGGNLVGGLNTSLANAGEIQRALLRFKESGKPVFGYLEDASQMDLYVAGVADQLYMHPFCVISLNGVAYQRIYFAEAFEKYGIGVQTAIAGGFKSALDTFTRSTMSPEDRQQGASLIEDFWKVLAGGIANVRGLDPAAVDTLSKQVGLIRAEQAQEAGLIDGVSHWDPLLQTLVGIVGKDEDSGTFHQLGLLEYSRSLYHPAAQGGEDKVAVVYVEGTIVEGEGKWNEAGSDRIARNLRKVREDENVKAVVVRVNSPGGSVTASEKIRREIELLTESRPVVISMGGLAASGGYWVSAGGDSIFAEPATVTGSIGVFAFIPNIEGLANDIGVTFDSVETSPFADMWSIERPKSELELLRLEEMVENVYQQFLKLVAEGRAIPVEDVHAVAQGRVWTGADAIDINLVDELGGLGAAISKAAEMAELGDFTVHDVPEEGTWNIFVSLLESKARNAISAGDPVTTHAMGWLDQLSSFNDPRGAYSWSPVRIEVAH